MGAIVEGMKTEAGFMAFVEGPPFAELIGGEILMPPPPSAATSKSSST